MAATQVHKVLRTAAVGPTAIWTPAAGSKWSLYAYQVIAPADTTVAGGAEVIVQLLDVAATLGLDTVFYCPNSLVGLNSLGAYSSGFITLSPGPITAAAAGTALNVTLSAALTGGQFMIRVSGYEGT